MKSLKFFALATFFAAALASCDSSKTETTEENTDTLTLQDTHADTTKAKDDDDKDFVQDAIRNNEMEMMMLADGQKLGTAKDIKDAAKKMAADHEKMGKQMKDYAAKKNITMDQDAHDMDDKNDDKKGAEWDEEWVEDMVEMHEKDVKKFEDAQNEVEDPELKTMIADALPILRAHLDMAKQLKAKYDK
ncbi:MAG: DUF4142 domain-containing protein [Sphingobacteriales bacterium]|nr:MAG: DUF4142 domain-containing protein [Sphingobacteriales bacterium]